LKHRGPLRPPLAPKFVPGLVCAGCGLPRETKRHYGGTTYLTKPCSVCRGMATCSLDAVALLIRDGWKYRQLKDLLR
jgi:hypothetical protein